VINITDIVPCTVTELSQIIVQILNTLRFEPPIWGLRHGRIYSQRDPVQKKMWGPFIWRDRPLFFLAKKLATFFCSSLAVHSGVGNRPFSRPTKICRFFCGAPFLWEHAEHV